MRAAIVWTLLAGAGGVGLGCLLNVFVLIPLYRKLWP